MLVEMKLQDNPFRLIKNGTKTIEMRLLDDKRKLLNVGDIIQFTNQNTQEKISTKIVKLHFFKNFAELYSHFNKTMLGYAYNEDAYPSDMELYYPIEEQTKFGVVGIEIESLK